MGTDHIIINVLVIVILFLASLLLSRKRKIAYDLIGCSILTGVGGFYLLRGPDILFRRLAFYMEKY